MKRANTILITTVMLSIALTTVFAFDFNDNSLSETSLDVLPFMAQAVDYEPIAHDISMEAVKMPDGMYAYRMLSYQTSDGRDLVAEGIYDTKPSIPGPTLVFTETDVVNLRLYNNACDDFVVGDAGYNENSLVGIHVHGVHYDISDDATYKRVNMNENSAASCDSFVDYFWSIEMGTKGTWPYHDHTFKVNEVGSEDVGLFGTVIVNPYNGKLDGLVKSNGKTKGTSVDKVDKEFILWMVSSETLGRSIFYGMEIDNKHPTTPGKQTALWTNPPLYTEEGKIVRFHVLGLGDETHAFHLHGHRWVDDQNRRNELIDVKEITPLQRHSFLIQASSNDGADNTSGEEAWMYHCHVFAHMQAGMSGMMHVVDNDTLPDVGAVFTLSDEPGLWMKTLDAGIVEGLDNYLEDLALLPAGTAKEGTGFPLNYLGLVLGDGFSDSQGRSLAVINPGETVLFGMKDSQTKHTITSLIWPKAEMSVKPLGGNGILNSKPGNAGVALFDTQLSIRGSTFLTDLDGKVASLDEPGLYVFVCQIHPYMISAVIVDDPDTSLTTAGGSGAWLPLLDLSDELTILTRALDPDGPDAGDVTFPVDMNPVNALPLELLKDFYVISDPSNWKDYTKNSWEVNLVPAFLTTNSESVVAQLHTDTPGVNATIKALDLVGTHTDETPTPLGANLDVDVTITNADRLPPNNFGVGEVWVNTQFERTVNKNPDGTSTDKPGTITVVDASDWSLDKKIALPEINMNHPHNMWTDTKNEIVYQTQWFDSRMVAIDRESGEMIKDNFVGQSPAHVMTSPTTGKIYITNNGEEQVTELDPNTYEITRQISTGPLSHPHGHWISSDGKYMVTPDFMSLSSTITNLEDNTTVKAQKNGQNALLLAPIATGMLGNTEDRKYYTADFLGNTLTVIDPENAQVIKQIDLLDVGAGLPIQTPVSPDDKWELTANLLGPMGASITIVDTSTDKIVATLQCDPGCHGVQWGAKHDPEGGYYAYVSSKFSNALIVVDPDPNNDGHGEDAAVVGKIILADRSVDTDDRVIGYDGMGGQGVLAIPNVYEGWIENTVDACESGECGEISDFIDDLEDSQKHPLD